MSVLIFSIMRDDFIEELVLLLKNSLVIFKFKTLFRSIAQIKTHRIDILVFIIMRDDFIEELIGDIQIKNFIL